MSTLSVANVKNSASPNVNLTLNSDGSTTFAVYSGTGAPTLFQTGSLWYDTSTYDLKIWNNTSWVALGANVPTGGGTDEVFYLNDQTVTTNYSIPVGKNAITGGTITVNTGVTVTVPASSTWSVV